MMTYTDADTRRLLSAWERDNYCPICLYSCDFCKCGDFNA